MSVRIFGRPLQPSPIEDPFQIRIHDGRRNTAAHSTVTAKIEIKLRDDAPVDDGVAFMSLRPTVVLDDNRRRDASERRRLSSITVDGNKVNIDDDSDLLLNVSKSKEVVSFV